jgi:catechol 2,3-dioxygenase-like lactoylglutathione lyase family enzyme
LKLKYMDAIFLPVTNIEKSLDWYTNVFGLKLNWRDKDPNFNAAGVGFKFGSFILVEKANINHSEHIPFNIYTSDVSYCYRTLKEKGVEVNQLCEYEDMSSFDFKDPDGYWIGIVGDWNEEGMKKGEYMGPDALFLPVRDIEKSAKWYTELFGIEYQFHQESSPQYPFRYAFWKMGTSNHHPKWFNLVETSTVFPMEHIPFNIQIEDADMMHNFLKDKGVKLTDIMDAGVFRWFNFIDPNGNEIGFVEGGKKF